MKTNNFQDISELAWIKINTSEVFLISLALVSFFILLVQNGSQILLMPLFTQENIILHG